MDRLIYGTRTKGRWAYVAGNRAELFRSEGAVVTTAGACCWCGAALLLLERIRREEAYLTILDPRSDDAEWRLRCEACGQSHLIAQMPARQCVGSPPPAYRPPAWAVDLDERDANARYGLGG